MLRGMAALLRAPLSVLRPAAPPRLGYRRNSISRRCNTCCPFLSSLGSSPLLLCCFRTLYYGSLCTFRARIMSLVRHTRSWTTQHSSFATPNTLCLFRHCTALAPPCCLAAMPPSGVLLDALPFSRVTLRAPARLGLPFSRHTTHWVACISGVWMPSMHPYAPLHCTCRWTVPLPLYISPSLGLPWTAPARFPPNNLFFSLFSLGVYAAGFMGFF